jgi:hypothetical protein
MFNKKLYKSILLLMLIFFIGLSFLVCTGKDEVTEENNNEEEENERPDPNDGPIFSYSPKDGARYLTEDAVLRRHKMKEEVSNPLLIGSDGSANFIIYLKESKRIIKLPKDGSLSIIIIEDDKLKTSEGEYLSGHVRDNQIILLQKTKSGSKYEYILRYFDTSGNILELFDPDREGLEANEIGFSNISGLIRSMDIELDEKYSYIAEDVYIMDTGNTAVTINESSSDNDHIVTDRPQFLIFDENAELVDVIQIIPPNWTAFGPDYWKDTEVERFHIDTAIYKNTAYILWGSGYSTDATLGYLYQKVSLRTSGAGTFATRVLKKGQNKDNRNTVSLPDEHTYASRGIWVDKGKVYVRLELDDGINIIDVYSSKDDYRMKYTLKDIPGLGKTTLTGPNNIIVLDDTVFWASDEGLMLFDLSEAKEEPQS